MAFVLGDQEKGHFCGRLFEDLEKSVRRLPIEIVRGIDDDEAPAARRGGVL